MLSAVMFALLLQMRFQSPGCTVGEGWRFAVRGGDVDRSPRWPDAADAPPLAPRAAIRAARSLLGRLSCKQPEEWEVAAVAFRPVAGHPNVWVYAVTLVEPLQVPKGSAAGSTLRRAVDIPVLLDGTALPLRLARGLRGDDRLDDRLSGAGTVFRSCRATVGRCLGRAA